MAADVYFTRNQMPASTAIPHRPSFLNPHLPLRDNQQIWPQLAPITRALLSTDGSFTLMLQSLSSEDIKPSVLRHQQLRAAGNGLDGCFEEGELLLQRAVLLKTAQSGRNLVYADSSIAVERLPAGMQQSLLDGSQPIGLLLRTSRLETYRELIDWGVCADGQADDVKRHLAPQELLYRRYRIDAGGQALMHVCEYFCASLFAPDES